MIPYNKSSHHTNIRITQSRKENLTNETEYILDSGDKYH
uniref:Uncharacterized protein n=1 Tax=Anguilla anguilla TaxID=7936 RepID=A0A0E9SDF5_ANGAN